MPPDPRGSIHIGGHVSQSVVVAGSGNVIHLGAMERAAAQVAEPQAMLRILAVLAAPVYDPQRPDRPPPPLDLRDEWQRLKQAVLETNAAILLARQTPPTLAELQRQLSPRLLDQGLFPQVWHFSGHGRPDGLLLEDELGRARWVHVDELLDELILPRPLDLVTLNACETADSVQSLAQALVDKGVARAAVGHPKPVRDDEAIEFSRTLYANLCDGYPLEAALQRANRHLRAHRAALAGDRELCFRNLGRDRPQIDDGLPRGNLPSRGGVGFYGRGRRLVEMARALHQRRSLAPALLVTGPPGIGKTTLALELAHRQAWAYPGGAAFAEAATGATSGQLLDELAAALELARTDDLLPATREQPILLVLDNLEELAPAERRKLALFLERLGEGSAALLTLRPPDPELEELSAARAFPLQEGLDDAAARLYAQALARQKGIPLQRNQAAALVEAARGHPEILRLLVAQAQSRDLQSLVSDVQQRGGDYARRLDRVYAWCAERVGEDGRRAWQILPLFPAMHAPAGPLHAAVAADRDPARRGLDELRAAAVIDFHAPRQLWTWHATAAQYATAHWPLSADARERTRAALLSAWREWLQNLPDKPAAREARLQAQRANLTRLIEELTQAPRDRAWDFLDALHKALPAPDRTLALREWEVEVYRVAVEVADSEDQSAFAKHMFGWALSALGRREAALEATKEAVALYRQLAQAQPQAFLPDLAASLTNLGAMLSELGRREEALQATEEAVALYRQLAQAQPQAFLPDLAMSLNNLGKMLSDLGRREEALEATEEAVAIRRKLAEAQPQAFLPYLAGSLNNLGNIYSELGRREEALEATEEAVGLYRQLAQAQPQAFLPNLALSLNDLGNRYADLGRREEALEATEEAVGLYRQLAEAHPQAFLPDLARSLGAYGSALQSMERHHAAIDAFAEGVRLLTPHFLRLPQAFASLMTNLIRDYLQACQAAGREPDQALLTPLLETLQDLSS